MTSCDRRALADDIMQAAIDGRLLHLGKKRSQTILAGVSAANPQRAIQEVDFKKNIQDFWATVKSPTPEGGTFTLPKMANAEMNTVGAFTNDSQSLGGSAPAINTASMRSIPKDGENVKPKTLGDKIRRQIMGEEAESLPNGFGYKAERP